jgi:hypothetical protein
MTEKDGSRLRSGLRLAALLAALPIALATTGGVIHTAPAPAGTAAQIGPVVDLGGAILVKSDHTDKSGDHRSGEKSSHDNGGERSGHDNGGERSSHDSGGERSSHESGRDRHDDRGDHKGAECHNCGSDNGDHRNNGDSGSHDNGGDHNGDHNGGEHGHCAPSRESLLEALLDGLCTGAESLERALAGAK